MVDGRNGNWQVISVAVQGVSHARQDLPCQDVVDHRVMPGGLLLAALSDGAGTAERADLGARRAVTAALAALEAGLETGMPLETEDWEALLADALEEARQALEDLSQEGGEPLRTYAATLTYLAASEAGLAIGQLGDGAVVARDDEGGLFTASQQQRGEYANETYFLSGDAYREQAHLEFIPGRFSALALMSDGLTRLALQLPAGEPHAPFFTPLFAFLETQSVNGNGPEALAGFLSSDRVNARTDDDKSLILAVRLDDKGEEDNHNGHEGL